MRITGRVSTMMTTRPNPFLSIPFLSSFFIFFIRFVNCLDVSWVCHHLVLLVVRLDSIITQHHFNVVVNMIIELSEFRQQKKVVVICEDILHRLKRINIFNKKIKRTLETTMTRKWWWWQIKWYLSFFF